MKKVLIFTYYWPPAGGVAVQRWLKFAKYLPEFGWEPIIVTVENGSYPYYDESLLKEVSPNLCVYKTKTFEPFEFYNLLRGKKGKSLPTVSVSGQSKKSFFQKITEHIRANWFIPDARKGWVKYAVKEGERILQKENIHCIVTTGPPHSCHLIGLELKKKYGVKWVADFRDPWTKILYNAYLPRTKKSRLLDDQLELETLKTADCVTTISKGIEADFRNHVKHSKVITNGFDLSDFSSPANTAIDKFTLRHVGNLIVTMNIPDLWEAIKELVSEHPTFKNHFQLEIIGQAHPIVLQSINENGLLPYTVQFGYVSHNEAVAYMKGASVLLFLVSDIPNSGYITSGKLFEYLASQRRILGIGPAGGDADEVLAKSHRGSIIPFRDKEEIKKRLSDYYEEWLINRNNFEYVDEGHLFYIRKNQTAELADLLNTITNEKI